MKKIFLMFLLVFTSLTMIGCDWFGGDDNGDGNGIVVTNPELAAMFLTVASAESYTLTMATEESDGVEILNMAMVIKGTATAFHVEMNDGGDEIEMYIVLQEEAWHMCVYAMDDWWCWLVEENEEDDIVDFVEEMKLDQWSSAWFTKDGNVYTLKPEHYNDALNLVEDEQVNDIEHLIITLTATTMKIEIKFTNADTPGFYEEIEVLFSHINNTTFTVPDLPLNEE